MCTRHNSHYTAYRTHVYDCTHMSYHTVRLIWDDSGARSLTTRGEHAQQHRRGIAASLGRDALQLGQILSVDAQAQLLLRDPRADPLLVGLDALVKVAHPLLVRLHALLELLEPPFVELEGRVLIRCACARRLSSRSWS